MASGNLLGGLPFASHITKALDRIYILLTSFSWLLEFSTHLTQGAASSSSPQTDSTLPTLWGSFKNQFDRKTEKQVC